MPDVLTHYSLSLLIAARFYPLRKALVIASLGVVPDLDAVFLIHRAPTHSIFIPLLFLTSRRQLGRIAAFLWTLHIAMDLFTGAVPIFAPFINSGLAISLNVNFETPMLYIDAAYYLGPYEASAHGGPVVTPQGAAVALAVIATLIIERKVL